MRTSSVSPAASRSIRGLAAALFAVFLLSLASGAQAHSVLLDTDPEDGEQLAVAPDVVTLTFNEDITDLGTEIVITTADDETINDGDTEIDGPQISQALSPDRPEGLYTVTWRAVSADGHPISGDFTFTAAEASGADTEEDGVEPDAADDGSEDETTADEVDQEDDSDEVTDDESELTDDADEDADSGGLSGSTWVIIGIIIVAAVILVTVLARAMGAKKEE